MVGLFLTVLPCNPQRIREKNGKFRVIFDASTRMTPDEIVLNDVTNRDDEAEIDFGKAKLNLLINIYNWRISYPKEMIYLALADITVCFRFPRISADVAGAFGFVAEGKYFVSTSMVFGSKISATIVLGKPLEEGFKTQSPHSRSETT
jgi:hypothetical protein